ncbi:MAG: DUF927 domain-containing protein [Roseiarcus sp.]|jgi:uncharacterized protein (DUF927 family)
MTSNYEAAVEWKHRGYNVVPRKAVDKKYPGVKWREFQTHQVTEAELAQWKPMFTNGVGFITGAISDVIVIETDGLAGETVLDLFEHEHGPIPETLIIRSGSQRGFHRHFRHPGHKVKTTANENIKVDVRGDGGFCVLPPSLHKSGGRYEIVHDAEPAELPPGLLDFIETKAREADETDTAASGAQGEPKDMVPADSGARDVLGILDQVPENLRKFDLEPNTAFNGLPPPVETMRTLLEFLKAKNSFEHRDGVVKDADARIVKLGWRECGMALKLAYPDAGFDLWASTHVDETARTDAPTQWASFAAEARAGDVTIGTVIKAAQDAGFPFGLATRPVSADPSKMFTAASGYVSRYPFTMDAGDGLTKEIVKTYGKKPTIDSTWICAPFEILGACRDPNGSSWGKLIRFRDADGRTHDRHISDAALQGDFPKLCADLADAGLRISPLQQRGLAEYLSSLSVDGRVTVVNRTGWHDIGGKHVFALPSEAIGVGDGARVIIDAAALGPYEARGSLDDWKQGVGGLTSGHALPVFMVSAALAGPLVHLVGAEGGGVHVFGNTSIGKSAMLQAAASVWGRGDTGGYVRSWRATANGLEGAAASATDTCLVLDELGLAEPRDVAASVYSLANGQGKARATRDGSLRDPKSWRVSVLSSGELPLEAKLGEDRGRRARAGQLLRVLDIPADRGLGFGAFDHAGGFGDAGKLADAIKSAAVTAYGTAGPEFIRRIVAYGVEKVADTGRKFIGQFVDRVVERGASEQVVRAAKKFALIAFAGELATRMGVTPWCKGEAREAAISAFSRWVEKRGGAGSHEERQAIEQVRLIIEQHGESRFELVADYGFAEEGKVRDRLGWRKGNDANREWFVPPEIWKAEVCAGLDHTYVARTLDKHGMLRRQDAKNLTCVIKLGGRPTRAYVLTAAIRDSGP